mgnify:CR=1 FL=1
MGQGYIMTPKDLRYVHHIPTTMKGMSIIFYVVRIMTIHRLLPVLITYSKS